MENSVTEYALQYAALGWPVLPLHWITEQGVCNCGKPDCKSPGKHPLTINGFRDASLDTAQIQDWGKKYPHANIGIATGAVSGVLALDIDPRHGGDESLDSIRTKHGKTPDDVMAVTGSGGNHYLFKYPGPVGRSTTNLYPGIDTRGDGGYIVVEPSNHISGKNYFWDAEANPLAGGVLPDAPEWLLAKLSQKQAVQPEKPTSEATLLPANEIKRIRAALAYIPADDRDQWRNVGMALNDTGAGDQAFGIWSEWSQQSEKFDLKDQRRVWDSFTPGGGITLAAIFGIAKKNGWLIPESDRRPEPPLNCYENDPEALPNTTTKPRKPRKKKPASQPEGDSAAQWLKIINRYVYIRQLNRFLDVVTRNLLTRESIDGGYCHLFQETNRISLKLLNDPEGKKADSLTYLYGDETNPIVNPDGSTEWNVYSSSNDIILPDQATDKDVKLWLKHLKYLFKVKKDRDHLLDWFAHLFQKPNVKINHAPLLGGDPGIGKDMALQPIISGLGAINVCQPSASELKETFTDFLYHAKLIIFQEASNFEKREIEDKLKPILASPPYKLRVRLFNSGFYTIPNQVQVIFMSNHKDSLHISDNDRRYFPIWSEAKPQTAAYYTKLAQWLAAGGNGAVVRWLKDRKIPHFNPKADPPVTPFKRQLMNTSKSPLKKLLIDKIKAYDAPFDVDIVRSDDVSKSLLPERYTTRAIGLALEEIKCFQRTCYKYQNGKRTKISLFAVRNVGEEVDDDGPKKWEALTPGTDKDKPINWRGPEKSKDKLWLDEYIKGDSDRHAKWGGVVPDDENRVDWE